MKHWSRLQLEWASKALSKVREGRHKMSHCTFVQSISWAQFFMTPWTAACQTVLNYLQELAQTHVHGVSGAIQPSHPLLSPSPPAINLSQHQGLLQWVHSSCHVAKVLELQLKHQFFQWIFRVDFLQDWLIWLPCSPRDSEEYSPTPQSESTNSSALSLIYGPPLTSVHDYWKNHSYDYMDFCQQRAVSAFQDIV